MFDLENEGQGKGVNNSQWCQSMVNINLDKSYMMHYCNGSHRFQDVNVSNVWPLG